MPIGNGPRRPPRFLAGEYSGLKRPALSAETVRQALEDWGLTDEAARRAAQKGVSAQEQALALYEIVINHGNAFFEAAQLGDERVLKDLIKLGMPVNLVAPPTGATALHFVAARSARHALDVLLETGQCDFLIRDKRGQLPSELAGVYGHDPEMAKRLGIKEREQADAQGITLTRRPAPAA